MEREDQHWRSRTPRSGAAYLIGAGVTPLDVDSDVDDVSDVVRVSLELVEASLDDVGCGRVVVEDEGAGFGLDEDEDDDEALERVVVDADDEKDDDELQSEARSATASRDKGDRALTQWEAPSRSHSSLPGYWCSRSSSSSYQSSESLLSS